MMLYFLSVGAYRETYHRYVDAIFTAKLGIGYITGVLELLLGALIYIMCLPCVRKSGHFQVKEKISFGKIFFDILVILLVSYVNTSVVNNNACTCTAFLEMVINSWDIVCY
jgi:hypothetical protein